MFGRTFRVFFDTERLYLYKTRKSCFSESLGNRYLQSVLIGLDLQNVKEEGGTISINEIWATIKETIRIVGGTVERLEAMMRAMADDAVVRREGR